MVKRVVIGGCRYFNDYALFSQVVDNYISRIKEEYEIIIVSGHCRGTDCLTERYAREKNLELEVFPADWSFGKKAGPQRNKKMIDIADYVIAFDSGGRGTKSLINLALIRALLLRVYSLK